MGCPAGTDLLDAVEKAALSNEHDNAACRRFWQDVSQEPPVDLAATSDDISLAQDFFFENSIMILQGLLHMSLAGGFASGRITRVLRTSSYLVPSKPGSISDVARDRTFMRLSETLQFVLDVMGAVVPSKGYPGSPGELAQCVKCMQPGEYGWRSAVRVRLLHGIARRRTRSHPSFNASRDGEPLNQQDMLATLASFSVVPIWTLIRVSPSPLPFQPSDAEREAYIAMWRHIGYYMGISPDLLRKHFSSYDAAAKLLATAGLSALLPESPDSSPAWDAPTMPLLRAIANRPPLRSTLEYHCAVSRFLLDDPLADHLCIYSTTLTSRIKLLFGLGAILSITWFGRVWPRRGWKMERIRILRHVLPRVVRNQLGMRRTHFRPRDAQAMSDSPVQDEQCEPDFVGGAQIQRAWSRLVWEMVAVCATAGLVSAVAIVKTYSYASSGRL
ncbi:hypothetical protein EXIGLDRAFT_672908 [Exidia glandulosa HHB12029]|uniref:ER-bound oxygenase mpaB/mpaB'/Rubber oxygenase catalytic domain-containing protein n=1 Tax=Exidia glandulosa HHB12029 TaxID=1314781 RepID=A0A165JCR3_EXIGL|nr:hypothetical protein EXIGLDRAFT_672908 [Exidia glandulosa HHB12029]